MNGHRQFIRRHSWGITVPAMLLLVWPGIGFCLNPSHDCTYCHSLHTADGVPILGAEEIEVLCLTCHVPGGHPDAPPADVHTNIGKTSNYSEFRATCMRCHNPHSNEENWLLVHTHTDGSEWEGINIKLVGRSGLEGFAAIETLEWDASAGNYADGVRYVTFEQLGTKLGPDSLKMHSFSDEDMDGNGVKDGPCEVCHNQTKHHCNGDDANIGTCDTDHNTGDTCTRCHSHEGNFLPPSSGGKPQK